MSQQQNLATVQEIYDAVGRGDVDAILDRVTDDVDWAAEAAGTAAPWHGPRTGKAGVARFFADLASSIEITEFTPHSFTAGETDVHLLVDWAFTTIADRPEGVDDDAPLLAPARRQGRVLPRQRRHRADGPGVHRLTVQTRTGRRPTGSRLLAP